MQVPRTRRTRCEKITKNSGHLRFVPAATGSARTPLDQFVKTEVLKANKVDILNLMKKPYKKISYTDHVQEEFHRQPYLKTLNIPDARLKFKLKTGMTPTVRMNFPSDAEFARQLWTCTGCSEDNAEPATVEGMRDTQAHILICPGYTDLREDKDLSSDKGLVDYFRLVMKKRLDTVD